MLKAGIVGLGNWGRHLVESVQGKSAKIRIAKGFTVDPRDAEGFADRHGIALTADLDALLDDREIDAVIVATPHSLHLAHIGQAAAAGKHVFVEKPLALNGEDAVNAAKACASAGVGLFVGYNWRFQPAVQELHAVVASGAIGKVLHMEGNYSGPSAYQRTAGSWRTLRGENPAGGMTGRGIHVINAMNLLCGPVISIFAFNDRRAAPDDLEDTTSALMRFENGVTGTVAACQVTAEYWRLHVFGSEGWAEMRMEAELTICKVDGTPQTTRFATVSAEHAELEAFADAVAANRFSQEAIRDAINGAAMLEAIDRSARSGQPVGVSTGAS